MRPSREERERNFLSVGDKVKVVDAGGSYAARKGACGVVKSTWRHHDGMLAEVDCGGYTIKMFHCRFKKLVKEEWPIGAKVVRLEKDAVANVVPAGMEGKIIPRPEHSTSKGVWVVWANGDQFVYTLETAGQYIELAAVVIKCDSGAINVDGAAKQPEKKKDKRPDGFKVAEQLKKMHGAAISALGKRIKEAETALIANYPNMRWREEYQHQLMMLAAKAGRRRTGCSQWARRNARGFDLKATDACPRCSIAVIGIRAMYTQGDPCACLQIWSACPRCGVINLLVDGIDPEQFD